MLVFWYIINTHTYTHTHTNLCLNTVISYALRHVARVSWLAVVNGDVDVDVDVDVAVDVDLQKVRLSWQLLMPH